MAMVPTSPNDDRDLVAFALDGMADRELAARYARRFLRLLYTAPPMAFVGQVATKFVKVL